MCEPSTGRGKNVDRDSQHKGKQSAGGSQKSSPDSEQKGSKKEALTKKKKNQKGKKEAAIGGAEGRVSDEEDYKSADSKSPPTN